MRNNKKSILTNFTCIITLLVIVFSSGCQKNFLDRQPLGQYTTNNYPYITGGGTYDQYIFAAYASLRSWETNGFGFVGAVSIRSDDADKGSTPADAAIQSEMDNFPVTPSNGLTNDLWVGYYAAITYCNVIINQVAKDNSGSSEATKMKAKGEAKFLRGYSYFMLVRLFGNVPIVDTVLANVSASNIPQSTSSQVYAFIEKDLQFAAANLPLRWDTKFIGRATSGAANGMLAKVYLYEKKWQMAMSTAGMVINSGVYDLKTPYDKIFTEAGENCSESIFEIQNYADANYDYGCGYAPVQGVRGSGEFNLGWGFNDPSVQLVAAYETGDPREASTILYCPSLAPTRYGEIFPIEQNPRYNMKVYTNPQLRKTINSGNTWVNVRILRYADIVLMYAEAANESGQTNEALQKLEWVRARARNGGNTILPPITTTDQSMLRDLIRHERRIEMAMEHERFFDLVRWGIADNALHAAGKVNFNSMRDDLLPISQIQIDLSKGILKQNPGY